MMDPNGTRYGGAGIFEAQDMDWSDDADVNHAVAIGDVIGLNISPTNNVGELTAIMLALEMSIKDKRPHIQIATDSLYAIKLVTE